MNRIVIAGAGVFGTALAERLARNEQNRIILYTIEKEVVEDINENHMNSAYFPARHINRQITATGELSCVREADYLLLVLPSKVIETFCTQIGEFLSQKTLVINMAKGFANDGNFITDIIPFKRVGSMKGPTFAVEVLNGLPSSLTYGGDEEDYTQFVSEVLPETGIITDFTSDMKAAELLSILKNMYAIAIGIISGRYNSPNVDFIMVTRAIGEMRALLELYGCDSQAIFTYCGIGDLGLTALNDLSRNRTLGLLIGKGFANDPQSSVVLEGMKTIKLMGELILGSEDEQRFPILKALYRLIYQKSSLNDYIMAVLN